jgi:GntR family transcriptional regulator
MQREERHPRHSPLLVSSGNMLPLNRSSKVPLYFQLTEILRDRIWSGDLAPGEMLPGEQDLLARFGVSRITVRRALSDLAREGFLVRQPGRGTFVSKPKIPDRSDPVLEFLENLRAQGHRPVSSILVLETVDVEKTKDLPLEILPGEITTHYVRHTLVAREPISIGEVWFSSHPDVRVGRRVLAARSIVPILRDDFGMDLVRTEQTIEATPAGVHDAAALGIKRGDAVLVAQSIVYDPDGRAKVFAKAAYRADRYKYCVSLPVRRT